MFSQDSSPRPNPERINLQQALTELKESVAAVERHAHRKGGQRPISDEIARMRKILAGLAPKPQYDAAEYVCEQLLGSQSAHSSKARGEIIRAVAELDQSFSVSFQSPEPLSALAKQVLLSGLSTMRLEELWILRRFLDPKLAPTPEIVAALSSRIKREVEGKQGPRAFEIFRSFRTFSELSTALLASPDFARIGAKLVGLMLDPWAPDSLTQEAPKFSTLLAPLPPERAKEYRHELELAFTKAVQSAEWSKARTTWSCARSSPAIDGLTAEELGRFHERLRRIAGQPIDRLLDGSGGTAKSSEEFLKRMPDVTVLLEAVFCGDYVQELSLAKRVRDSAHRELHRAFHSRQTVQQGIDTVLRLSAMYALFPVEQRRAQPPPLFRRSRVWVVHKLNQLSAELWHLSAFGPGDPPPPEFSNFHPREFTRFKVVVQEAHRVFNLGVTNAKVNEAVVAHGLPAYLNHSGRETSNQLPASDDGLLNRLFNRWGHQQELKRYRLEAEAALNTGQSERAFAALSSLLRICALSTQQRGSLVPDQIKTASTLLQRSCGSAPMVRGMLASMLMRELQRPSPDRSLVSALAQEIAALHRQVGKSHVAARLESLGRVFLAPSSTPAARAEAAAGLRSRCFSRI
ncbi:MAG: hypothetical protein EBZ48_09585 [Proteobacteria bacterium]|nr:hypothetical protein [Pseudomonadota bacterium]